jgi:hypothetical protein
MSRLLRNIFLSALEEKEKEKLNYHKRHSDSFKMNRFFCGLNVNQLINTA